jgi:ATP-dependent helicase HrpA
MKPQDLPVYQQREKIIEALSKNQTIVVESPTGSGKTTQLPLILHEAGYSAKGVIGVTQPRRIAAVSVSEYIARQLGTTLPGLVGYKMRFEDITVVDTRIKIMTDGILLQELKADYTLSKYSVIIVDEAHERSLNIDFILGLLKRILDARPEFKVIISSATLNTEVFSQYFGTCPIVRIETPMFPVRIEYTPPDAVTSASGNGRMRPFQIAAENMLLKIGQIVEKHIREIGEKETGDILIFLPGEKMIKDCITMLSGLSSRKKLHLLPLYGRLSREEQERVFPPPPEGKIKIVIATNIAETSVTIDGITAVIDSGLAKMNYYSPRTFTSSLIEKPVSRASSNQRKGRAGRTRPGTCYRLYTKKDFEIRELFTLEEIYRTDLSEVVLRMAEIGIQDFESFDFLSPPGKGGIIGAVDTLMLLDALNDDHTLSVTGKMMAEFPLLPVHSRMIVESVQRYPQVMEEVLIATSFLTTNSPFLLPQGEELAARKAHHTFSDPAGDFISYLKIFRTYTSAQKKDLFCEKHYLDTRTMAEIVNIKEQLQDIVGEMGIPILSMGEALSDGGVRDYLCAVSRGLIQFVCIRSGRGVYRSLTAEKIQIHPGSVMFRETPRFIVAGEIVKTTKMWARSVSPLIKQWLPRISEELSRQLLPKGTDDERNRSGEDSRKNKKSVQEEKKTVKDTSWQIKIGPRLFELKPYKGKKKIAILPWDELKTITETHGPSFQPYYSKMRGKVLFQGRDFLAGEKIGTILTAARCINPEHDITNRWPSRKNYDLTSDRISLVHDLKFILKLAPLKKNTRQLGMIALFTEGDGIYWFRCIKRFNTAVTESLSSLETLADYLEEETDPGLQLQVSKVYRRLASIWET